MITFSKEELHLTKKISDDSVDAFIDRDNNCCIKIRRKISDHESMVENFIQEIQSVTVNGSCSTFKGDTTSVFAIRVNDGSFMVYYHNEMVHPVALEIKLLK